MSELKAHPAYSIYNRAATLEESLVYLKSEADKVIAHQKYKRCLAMAKWCKEAYWQCPGYKEKFYERWTDKWRELAEKFKEVK